MRHEIKTQENPVKPLTAPEIAQFKELQKIIKDDMRAFLRVGRALIEIRDRELYREDHKTFEGYYREVFDFGKSYAHRLIGAAQVVDNISQKSPMGDKNILSPSGGQNDSPVIDLIPINERQARPLTMLQPDQQREVWQAVIENADTCPGNKITAGLVNQVTKWYLGEKTKSKVKKARKEVSATTLINEDLQKAFDDFLDELEKEVEAGLKASERDVIVSLLDQLRETLVEACGKTEETAFTGGASDANKLEKAGFSLFRMDKMSKAIKIRSGGGWPHYSGPFKTIKEMEKAFVELMQDPKHLRG